MPANYDENRMISYEEFEILCSTLQRYKGFVENNGYVFWEPEQIYFIVVEYKKYQQIFFWLRYDYQRQGYTVISKTKYNLCILSPEMLEKSNPELYRQYSELMQKRVEERLRKEIGTVPVAKNDAIQPPKRPLKQGVAGKSTDKKILEGISNVDDVVGLPLGVISEFSTSKKIPVIGNFLTAVSIINDLDNGDYFTAGGKTIKAFSGWYGLVWDIGEWASKTDFMQRQQAGLNAQAYKEAERKYLEACSEHDFNAQQKYREQMKNLRSNFKDNMDNLGIKYHE